MSTYFLRIRSNSRITFIVFGGIVLCIVPSCMYRKYFLLDFGPSSEEDVTFVLAYYHYVRASLPLKIMTFALNGFL